MPPRGNARTWLEFAALARREARDPLAAPDRDVDVACWTDDHVVWIWPGRIARHDAVARDVHHEKRVGEIARHVESRAIARAGEPCRIHATAVRAGRWSERDAVRERRL